MIHGVKAASRLKGSVGQVAPAMAAPFLQVPLSYGKFSGGAKGVNLWRSGLQRKNEMLF
jgi:hypothetical protein